LVALHAKEEESMNSFIQFISQYKKQYKNQDEFMFRFQIFKDSLKRISLKNKQFDSIGATYGITKFSDLSHEEFASTVLMKNPISTDKNVIRSSSKVLKPKNVDDIPLSINWKDKGAVTPIKDQAQCGSCWAFSVVENIESMYIIAGKANNESIDLSPQQLVDCNLDDLGCYGGIPVLAYRYIINSGGIDSEEIYPYVGKRQECHFVPNEIAAKISDWKFGNQHWFNETEIQYNLASWGPLSICLDASVWQDYTSGILTAEECSEINILNHCVDLVGYVIDIENLSNSYWIVRNSWGLDWGNEGFIYLQMWKDTCGMADFVTTSVI